MKMNFQQSLEMGRTGERQIATALESSGWWVIPSYDYTGRDGDKAPKMRRLHDCVVVPDLDCCRNGERVWVEVKTKSEIGHCRMLKNLETHGIDLKHWISYRKIQGETGCRVFLVIRELCTGKNLGASIDDLEKDIIHGIGKGAFMVYFPRSSFEEF
jgi:hypothetical protein